jgi:hypothetical protein
LDSGREDTTHNISRKKGTYKHNQRTTEQRLSEVQSPHCDFATGAALSEQTGMLYGCLTPIIVVTKGRVGDAVAHGHAGQRCPFAEGAAEDDVVERACGFVGKPAQTPHTPRPTRQRNGKNGLDSSRAQGPAARLLSQFVKPIARVVA